MRGNTLYVFDLPNYKAIPKWNNVSLEEFSNHLWQERNCITKPEFLKEVLGNIVSDDFFDDLNKGQLKTPMALRITPYIISLVDWNNWRKDPIRRQFIPLMSEMESDHPMASLDPMEEQSDSPTLGLSHRYPDKALLLANNVCPVYCRYCTRAYAIGGSTDTVSKVSLGASKNRLEEAISYIKDSSKIEDIVVSGGDAFRLKPKTLLSICEELLSIPHVRRIRVATKGLAVLPVKITSDREWTDAVVRISDLARSMLKQFSIQTHFNHPQEISEYTRAAMSCLFSKGVVVRNQSVLLRGVNDNSKTVIHLNKLLSHLNIQPYYVYIGDMTKGAEDLRTSLDVAISIEKEVRGQTSGYNTPTFVVDLPGGGGKRDIHSFESYDRTTGIARYISPVIDESRIYQYCDPISYLPLDGRKYWEDIGNEKQLEDAL